MTESQGPIVVRVVSRPLRAGMLEFVEWVVGHPRPDGYQGTVVRMFLEDAGVEVYWRPTNLSETTHGRLTIPWPQICCVEEIMEPDVFAQEISEAQTAQFDDDEDEGGGDEDQRPAAAGPAAQRQGTHA